MNRCLLVCCLTLCFLALAKAWASPRPSFLLRKAMHAVVEVEKGQFEAEVKMSSEPVLVDFYAKWCGPCKMMHPIINELSKEVTGVKFAKVDTDSFPDEAALFNVRGLPTFFLMHKGQVVATHVGAMQKEPLREFISRALKTLK